MRVGQIEKVALTYTHRSDGLSAMLETRVPSLGREGPLGKEMATHSLLPGKSHGKRSLVGYSQGVAKSRTRLSNFTYLYTLSCVKWITNRKLLYNTGNSTYCSVKT